MIFTGSCTTSYMKNIVFQGYGFLEVPGGSALQGGGSGVLGGQDQLHRGAGLGGVPRDGRHAAVLREPGVSWSRAGAGSGGVTSHQHSQN